MNSHAFFYCLIAVDVSILESMQCHPLFSLEDYNSIIRYERVCGS